MSRLVSRAAQAGDTDGSVAALAFPLRTASDAFVRRTEIDESERAEYHTAFDAAYQRTSKVFRIGRYAS